MSRGGTEWQEMRRNQIFAEIRGPLFIFIGGKGDLGKKGKDKSVRSQHLTSRHPIGNFFCINKSYGLKSEGELI